MTNGCYTGCTPPTTIITHAPHVVQHLAFTGAPIALDLKAGLIAVAFGLILILGDKLARKAHHGPSRH